MHDFIKQYKKKNVFMHISLLTLSFIFALSFYTYTKDSSFTESLKGNVLEQTLPEDKNGEMHLLSVSDEVQKVIIDRKVDNISSLSFSLSFNPYDIQVLSIVPFENINANVEIVSNTPGYITALINFPTPINTSGNDTLFSINTRKISNNISLLNLIQANITDTTNTIIPLSSSGIDF